MITGTDDAMGDLPSQAGGDASGHVHGGSGGKEPVPPAAGVPPTVGWRALAQQLPFLGPDL